MGLLIFFFLISGLPSVQAAFDQPELLHAVLYDFGDSRRSVAIVGTTILQEEDLYRQYRVIGFEPDAVVFKSQEDGSGLKWPLQSDASVEPALERRARHLFIVRQLRAIYQAQIDYLRQFKDGFAPDLEILIQHEFLADGFEEGVKQGYVFEIAAAHEEYGREPSFLAVASPEEEGGLFFSVDHLGQVRSADTYAQTSWGPVWDYRDHSGASSRPIGIQQ